MKFKVLLFVMLLTAGSTKLFAQNHKDSLNRKLDKAFLQSKVPGFAALIVDRNGIIYQKSLGYSNINTRIPFTEKTIENIGSVSKTFIAVALMKAIELGYFTLETNINEILPFKVLSPFAPDEIITIRHLATHTSGIIDNDSIYNRSYLFEKNVHTNQTVSSFMKERGYVGGLKDTTLPTFLAGYLSNTGKLYSKANFADSRPGQRSAYSNIGSALAAYLIEVKAGMSFSAFCERYILLPLKMHDSKWFLSKVDRRKHAIPYFNQEMSFPFYSLTTYPDGGLRTTAADLGKYVSEMIRSLNNKPGLLDKSSIDTMFAPQFSANNLPANFSLATRNKAIFWNLYSDGFIGHDGDDPGVCTNILFNGNYGIIFMTNIYLEDRSSYLNALKQYVASLIKSRKQGSSKPDGD